MSRGSGRVERRIVELFAATKDRALSVGDLAAHAFELADGVLPDRKQRLSATSAAHRLIERATAVNAAQDTAMERMIAEATAQLGRPPIGHANTFSVDDEFRDAMHASPNYLVWARAGMDRYGAPMDLHSGGWCTSTGPDGRLWFHPVGMQPAR
jgi:hypothetical protein